MTTPNAPRTRPQQFAFLREQVAGPLKWRRLCLSLARQAPRLPAIYPSARAAMLATPKDRRYPLAEARRGMVAYFSDPNDSNTADHIVTLAGWDGKQRDLDDLLTFTNDAKRSGGVDVVRASFFPQHWGDPFVFATDWLNGYDLPGYDDDAKPTPAPGRETLGANYDHAIEDLRREMRKQRAAGNTTLVNMLAKDLAHMKRAAARFA